MAIISANEVWEGRTGGDDAQGGRTDSRTFVVVTDSHYDDPTTIKAAGVLPERRSAHPNDAGMWVVDRSFSQDAADPRVWRVTVSYASMTGLRGSIGSSGGAGGGGGGANELQENPLQRRAEFSFSTDKFQEELNEDFTTPTAKQIRNSAKEPFFPPLSRPRGRMVMTYTKNFSNSDFIQRLELWDLSYGSMNSDIFADFFEPYTLLFDDLSSQDAVENGVYFWRCTFRFLVKFSGWAETDVVDQGYRELLANGKYRNIEETFGRPLQRPAYLDGAGLLLSPQTATPVPITFQLYPAVSFAFFA